MKWGGVGGGAAEMDVAASLAQGKTIRVATVHLAAARKKNLELMSKVASKGPMLHPATTAHLSTEKALQEFDSLFSDTRKLLLSTIHADGHFFHTAAAPAAFHRWRANGKCHTQ